MPTPAPAVEKNGQASETKPASRSGRRERSVNYPAHTIMEAVAKAEAIYRADKKAAITTDIAAQHMGFKNATNGAASLLISSLRKYGLLDRLPNGEVRISDDASLLFIYDRASSEYREALARLAMRPPIFGEVLKKFPGELPSDMTLRAKLQHEFGFVSADAANACIRALRAALSVDRGEAAGQNSGSDATPKEGALPPPDPLVGEKPPPPHYHPPPPPAGQQKPIGAGEQERHVWKLGEGSWAEVTVTGRLTTRKLEKLKVFIGLLDAVDDGEAKSE